MDDAETLRRFKDSLKAQFHFVPDPEGELVGLYDVKTPVLSYAQRYTFVIGQDRKILKVDSGGDAIDASKAISACPLRKRQPPAKGPQPSGH